MKPHASNANGFMGGRVLQNDIDFMGGKHAPHHEAGQRVGYFGLQLLLKSLPHGPSGHFAARYLL
ncbi:hypothetical protein D3C80_2112520 [compost metagenome]